jgi:hypothetical protein
MFVLTHNTAMMSLLKPCFDHPYLGGKEKLFFDDMEMTVSTEY